MCLILTAIASVIDITQLFFAHLCCFEDAVLCAVCVILTECNTAILCKNWFGESTLHVSVECRLLGSSSVPQFV